MRKSNDCLIFPPRLFESRLSSQDSADFTVLYQSIYEHHNTERSLPFLPSLCRTWLLLSLSGLVLYHMHSCYPTHTSFSRILLPSRIRLYLGSSYMEFFLPKLLSSYIYLNAKFVSSTPSPPALILPVPNPYILLTSSPHSLLTNA